MKSKKLTAEVLVADERIVKLRAADIGGLKAAAPGNPRGRIRLCAHQRLADPVHEMMIVMPKSTYIRPHRHDNKSESFHLIEGRADIVLFDAAGQVADVVEMGSFSSGRYFFFRISEPCYHTPIILSDFAVYHETTRGPFRKSEAGFAPWAPDEADQEAVARYRRGLRREVAAFLASRKEQA